jgi:hypothetical protein
VHERISLWHTLWALLVWLSVAQWLLDFVFRLHMIAPPYKVVAFDFATAAGLVLLTAFSGYMFGWMIALIWNRCGRRMGLA